MATTMTTTKAVLQQAYRGSIVLNNYGCCLLQHQSYPAAAECLRDAVQTMRAVLRHISVAEPAAMMMTTDDTTAAGSSRSPEYQQQSSSTMVNDGDDDSNQVLFLDVGKRVHEAALRMASISSSSSHHPESQSMNPRIKVQVLATGDFNQLKNMNQSRRDSQHDAIYPVRIDDVNNTGGSDKANFLDDRDPATSILLEMHVAVALHNLALAHHCVSLTTSSNIQQLPSSSTTTTTSSESSSGIMTLFSIAQDILGRLSLECYDAGLFYLERQTLCLNYTAVQNLLVVVRVLEQVYGVTTLNGGTRIQELYQSLEQLQGALDELSPWWGDDGVRVAAKAA